MRIEDLIDTLFKDVAAPAPNANSPGEMVRQSLAGQMPGMLPQRRAPMAPMASGAPVMPVTRAPMPPAMPVGGPAAAPSLVFKPGIGAVPAGPEAPAPAPAPAATTAPQPGWGEDFMAGAAGNDLFSGLIGGFFNASNAPQRRARAEAEKAKAENQTVQALIAAGAPPAIANATVGNPLLMKQAVDTYIKPSADPLERTKRELEIEKLRKDIAGGGGGDDKTPAGRASLARSLGLKEGSDAYNAYVMTGKLPREDQQRLTVTDKKAILEADEAVSATEGAIASLRRAMDLSKTAYDGMLAGERGWLTSQFGSGSGNDTRELNQVVTEGALQQLKAIFGGMPTEGERKILLEIQGSAEMPQEVRDRIYQRALALAERRLKFNQDRANELRSGTFYERDRPADGAAPAAPAEPAGGAPAPGAVMDGYRFKGGDPADRNSWEKVS